MRRNFPVFFAILFLGIVILFSGCTVPGIGKSSDNSGVSVGLSQIPTQEISPSISYDEAIQQYEEYTGKLPVYYLIAKNIDNKGNALHWLFGVHYDNGTALFILDRTGWNINPWDAVLPPDEIPLNQVIAPEKLFILNSMAISNASYDSGTVTRDLELQEGTYTLTIRSDGASRQLVFNATTGALISDHV